MRSSRGFTLAEALLSLGLILLSLGILSSLLGDFSLFQRRFFRDQGAVNHTPELLRNISSELWQAQSVTTPLSGSSASLVLSRVPDGTLRDRPSRDEPSFPDLVWQTDNMTTFSVRYNHESELEQIRRQSQGRSQLLGVQVKAFTVDRQNDENSDIFRIRLQVQDGERLRDWQTEVVKTRVW